MLQSGIPRIFLQAFSPSVGFNRGPVVVEKKLIPSKVICFGDIIPAKLFRFVRNGDGSTAFYFRILGIKPDRSPRTFDRLLFSSSLIRTIVSRRTQNIT